jgi:hypothetical protein
MIPTKRQALDLADQLSRMLAEIVSDRHGAADDYGLCDSYSLVMDACSQLRGSIAEDEDRREVA